MAALVATHLHDPFAHTTHHFSPAETSSLLSLLAVDHIVDSHAASSSPDVLLLNDLLAVDTEFARADARDRYDVATASSRRDERDVFLDLLGTDMAVDGVKRSPMDRTDMHHVKAGSNMALHDPYAREERSAIHLFPGAYATTGYGASTQAARLRDDAAMMHLLAVDEDVDGSKRYQRLIASDDYAIVGELHAVDVEVGGAKRRALLTEDLRGLLDVDHLVDGVKKHAVAEGGGGATGGKRSIFSMKEKYVAKVSANKFS